MSILDEIRANLGGQYQQERTPPLPPEPDRQVVELPAAVKPHPMAQALMEVFRVRYQGESEVTR